MSPGEVWIKNGFEPAARGAARMPFALGSLGAFSSIGSAGALGPAVRHSLGASTSGASLPPPVAPEQPRAAQKAQIAARKGFAMTPSPKASNPESAIPWAVLGERYSKRKIAGGEALRGTGHGMQGAKRPVAVGSLTGPSDAVV